MIQDRNMYEVVNENFERYAGNVILDRAICDVRDMLKPSARMLIYSQQHISKNIHSKPFIKSARVVGDCLGHLYQHGESSCYQSYVRMCKPFAMRVPLEECQGNSGTIIKTGDEAAMRYTELRLNEISHYLYDGLDKNAIGDEWKINFDETEDYPGVMPSIGYFNICNGTQGLGIAISSSIPQFNLREVNEAIIKLLRDPDASVDIMPDFATGGTLLNAEEVRESLRVGTGKACRLRANMVYDPNQNSIIITEIPYGVYTSTILDELREKVEADENYGIKSIHDNSGQTAEIIIELEKNANPRKMIQKLYHDSSLESFFTINMWVLKNGRYPQVMGLKEIFENYIEHIRTCQKRIIQYDYDKLALRDNVINGLLVAAANIDEVIKLIRSSEDSDEAYKKLQVRFALNHEQIKAILAIKLASLTKIDSIKLQNEQVEVKKKMEELNILLTNPAALDDSLITILQSVADKFGDDRRTVITNFHEENIENAAPAEDIVVMVLSNNCLRITKSADMTGSKKGRKGTNLKLPDNVIIKDTLNTDTQSKLCVITDSGKVYFVVLSKMNINADNSIYDYLNLNAQERIVKVVSAEQFDKGNLVMITKLGYIKKSEVSEYNTNGRGVIGIKLNDGDSVIAAFLSINDDDEIIMVNNHGYYNRYKINAINTTGRVTKGVQATKLKDNEYLVAADMLYSSSNYIGVLTINNHGQGKITELSQLPLTSRTSHGNLVQKLDDGDSTMVITAIRNSTNLIHIMSNKRLITINIAEVPIANRVTKGVKLIDIRGVVTDLYAIAK